MRFALLRTEMLATRTGPARNTETAVVLEARGLVKTYQMGEVVVHALRGVDLALREGELIVLLGPSGSGKSTLLNILGGLDLPTSGGAFYRGEELTRASERELTRYRREHVGFVFQFYNVLPSLTARENVALVTEISRQPMKPEEALALVGLEHRLDHFPSQLSGGEQQRSERVLRGLPFRRRLRPPQTGARSHRCPAERNTWGRARRHAGGPGGPRGHPRSTRCRPRYGWSRFRASPTRRSRLAASLPRSVCCRCAGFSRVPRELTQLGPKAPNVLSA